MCARRCAALSSCYELSANGAGLMPPSSTGSPLPSNAWPSSSEFYPAGRSLVPAAHLEKMCTIPSQCAAKLSILVLLPR